MKVIRFYDVILRFQNTTIYDLLGNDISCTSQNE